MKTYTIQNYITNQEFPEDGFGMLPSQEEEREELLAVALKEPQKYTDRFVKFYEGVARNKNAKSIQFATDKMSVQIEW